MGAYNQSKNLLSDDEQALANRLSKAVRAARSLEQLASSLEALVQANPSVGKVAAARLDFSRLPRFGGEPVADDGAISWDEAAVLYMGEAGDSGFAALEVKRRAGPAPAEPPPADGPDGDPATSAEAIVRLIEAAQAGEPSADDFEQAVRANADELNVEISSVAFQVSPQHVTIQIAIPQADAAEDTRQTQRPRAGWAGRWRQIAAELVAQIAGGGA